MQGDPPLEPDFVAVGGQPETIDLRPETDAFSQSHRLEMAEQGTSLAICT